MFCSYQEMYYSVNDMSVIVDKRLDMVHMAREIGYRATARFYKTDRNTVRKWCRRYALEGLDGLKDKSKKPITSPSRINQNDIDKISNAAKDAKLKKKYITVKNIRRKTKIRIYSDATINRYIKKAIGKKKNCKKDHSNGHSTQFKQKLKPFEIIQVDIKYLTDIDNLKPYFDSSNDRSLVKFQITARDVLTGFPLVAYCYEKSVFNTTRFLNEVLLPFLNQFKYLNLKDCIIQTDNGAEFTNKYINTKEGNMPKDTSFTIFVNNHFKKHRTNIPGHCTANSEVENFHWNIERDCLAWEDITDNKSLIKYVNEYINLYIRTKISTKNYSPYQKIKETLKVKHIKVPKPIILT